MLFGTKLYDLSVLGLIGHIFLTFLVFFHRIARCAFFRSLIFVCHCYRLSSLLCSDTWPTLQLSTIANTLKFSSTLSHPMVSRELLSCAYWPKSAGCLTGASTLPSSFTFCIVLWNSSARSVEHQRSLECCKRQNSSKGDVRRFTLSKCLFCCARSACNYLTMHTHKQWSVPDVERAMRHIYRINFGMFKGRDNEI